MSRLYQPAERLARYVGAQRGWRRLLAAILAGLAAAAALPPLYILPALWVAFPVFFWLVDGAQRTRDAALTGWGFGFGYFLAGLHWISYSLLVDGDKFAWMIPFALLLIPAFVALFIAVAAWLAHLAPAGGRRLLALAAGWVLMEWARAYLFTGFPWNPLAVVWMAADAPMQGLALFGGYGLGFVTALIALAPCCLAAEAGRIRIAGPVAALAALALLWGGGALRLHLAPVKATSGVADLRIVQPNIPQHLKWRRELREKHLATLLRLSRQPPDQPPSFVIWPETAVPYVLSREAAIRRVAGAVVAPGRLLLTGSLRASPPDQKPFRLWNSFHAIDANGDILKTYDKYHLVPFGEYVPLRGVLGISKITQGRTDFTAGPKPAPLDLPGLPPVAVQICYEIIFPDEAASVRPRPGWILNITNDAWFGDSAGPRQHLALAQMRAVALGLPVVRAANTGISALIGPRGRITRRLAMGQQGVIDASLPRALPPTPYSRVGEYPVLLFLLLVFGLSSGLRKRG